MKIRNGFVSNSSTSSFHIYGICLEEGEQVADRIKENATDDMKELLLTKNNAAAAKSSYRNVFDDFASYMDSFEEDSYELWYEIGCAANLSVNSPEYYGTYIGIDPSKIGDDETGREFKTRVENIIKSLLGSDTKGFGWHEEAWRDG
ncbi:MAG: hypothetical protein HOG49_25180 [Candidatus Scalindua sp.]|nr:hypothetical protein [Candidatus Scalindua sp.]